MLITIFLKLFWLEANCEHAIFFSLVTVYFPAQVSTMIRYGTNPIIFLANNDGYTIEVEIHDGVSLTYLTLSAVCM